MNSYFPIAIIVLGGLIYQFSQKSVGRGANVYYTIVVAYLAGILLCVIANLVRPEEGSLVETFRRSGWAAYGIGLGAVLVEVGFLMAFRQGWRLSLTSILVSMVMGVILVPVGILIYREKISGWNALGVLFYFAGLLLVSRK